jgi:hypothetical protein
MCVIEKPSTNDPVAAATQALDPNGLAPLSGVHRAGHPTRKRTDDRTAEGVAIVISGPQSGPDTGAKDGRRGGFVIELVLIARQGLASGKVGPIGLGRRPIEDRFIVCAMIGTGRHQG